jgi:hypothetical protein
LLADRLIGDELIADKLGIFRHIRGSVLRRLRVSACRWQM